MFKASNWINQLSPLSSWKSNNSAKKFILEKILNTW
jgi:hypothetical protein